MTFFDDPRRNAVKILTQRLQGVSAEMIRLDSLGGGSINDTMRVSAGNQQFVLKRNSLKRLPGLLKAEANGLAALAAPAVIRVPKVEFVEEDESSQYLLLEWIAPGNKTRQFWERFGEQLAALHQQHSDKAGWDSDNYMGALEQYNDRQTNWVSFFIEKRLQPQLELARSSRLADDTLAAMFTKLYPRLETFFPEEPFSLLHGDLWSGNFLCDENDQPVLIDPAVYAGHRSIDMGMTTLFGGFDQRFYESYQSNYPQEGDYQAQWEICNLYPLLIHLNLFGAGYRSGIERILRKYG